MFDSVNMAIPFFFGVLCPFSEVEPFSLFSLEESSPPESLLDWVDWLLDEAWLGVGFIGPFFGGGPAGSITSHKAGQFSSLSELFSCKKIKWQIFRG